MTPEHELNKIGMWLDEFSATPNDSTYLCFLRLLCDYRELQTQLMRDAIERIEQQELNTK